MSLNTASAVNIGFMKSSHIYFRCQVCLNTASAVNIGFILLEDLALMIKRLNTASAVNIGFKCFIAMILSHIVCLNTASAVNIGFSRLRLSTDNSQRSTDLDVQNFTTLNLKL